MTYKQAIIFGFLSGMFALTMLAFKVSMDSMAAYEIQLEQTRFRLIREATEIYREPENIVIMADETLIINYEEEGVWR